MTPLNDLYPAPHLSDADVQRETYAGVKVLLERTADLGEIRAKVADHDRDIRRAKKIGSWVGAGLVSALFAKFGIHFSPHA